MVDVQPIDTVMAAWIIDQDLLDHTQRAVESLKGLGGMRLIVVDNDSLMGGGYLRNESHIYIKNSHNLGYAPAMNQGIKLSSSDLVCFAENDILVSPNAFDVAREVLKDPKIGSLHYRMALYDEPLKLGSQTWTTGKERWCTFSFFVIKKEALPPGLLDENYIMANYEDYDFLQYVRTVGKWQTAYTNRACYAHHDSYTQRKTDQTKRQQFADKNREYFKKKWGEYPDECFQKQFPDQWKQDWRLGFYAPD